jgi:hypothetical protein
VNSTARARYAAYWLLLLAIVGAAPTALLVGPSPEAPNVSAWSLPGAQRVTGMPGAANPVLAQLPPPKDAQAHIVYHHDDHPTYFNRFSYWTEQRTGDIVPYLNQLWAPAWSAETIRARTIPGFRTLILRHSNSLDRYTVAYHYRVGDAVTFGYRSAKLRQVVARLTGKNLFEIVVLTAPCVSPDCSRALESLASLAASLERPDPFDPPRKGRS